MLNNVTLGQLTQTTVGTGTSFPTNAVEGQLFQRTDNQYVGLYVYDGSAWGRISDTSSILSVIGYTPVNRAGDTMDGPLVLSRDPQLALEAVTKQYVDYAVAAGTGGGGTGLTPSGVTPGIYRAVTVNLYGQVTSGANPNTLAGYGIIDAQPLDTDLTSIAALGGTTGYLIKNGPGSWAIDSRSFLTANQLITASGDVTGAGSTAINLTLVPSGVAAGTYTSVTVDAKGRVISGTNPTYQTQNQTITLSGDATGSGATDITVTLVDTGVGAGTYGSATRIPTFDVDSKGRITMAADSPLSVTFSALTGLPTTLAGYGITDAQPLNSDLTAISNLPTSGVLRKIGTGNWTLDTGSYLTANQNISVSGDATGSGSTSINLTLVTVNPAPVTNAFVKVTTNSKGLVTATSPVSSADVAGAFGYTPVNKAGDTMSGALVLSGDPTAGLQAVTKQYVDNIAAGLSVHLAVQAASNSPYSANYSNGAGGVGATLTATANGALVVAGYTAFVGDRVLIKDQVAALQNGVYVVSNTGSVSTPWLLTRAADFDNNPVGEVAAGAFMYVQQGALAGSQWVVATTGSITVGTTAITFSQLSGQGAYNGGPGITVASNIINNTGVLSVTGTANQVTAATTAGAVTLSLPAAVTIPGAMTAGSFAGAGTGLTGTASGLVVGSATNLSGGTVGAVHYQSAVGVTSQLPIGTTGQVLTVVNGSPAWSASAGTIASVTGTTNQVSVTTNGGAVTVALPSAVTISGAMTAGSFAGAGTGLTGTASALTVGTATNVAGGTNGAVLYQTAAGATSALTIGTTGQVLTVSPSGLPIWSASTGGVTSIAGTANQVVASASTGAVTLSLPSAITISGAMTAGSFVGNASSATNLAGGTVGAVLYQSAVGVTSQLPIGTTGQVLSVAGGVPAWAAVPASISSVLGTTNQVSVTTTAGVTTVALPSAVTISGAMTAGSFVGAGTGLTGTATGLTVGTATAATNLTGGAAGSIHYQTAANTTTTLPIGTTGQVLSVVAGVPAWAAVPSSIASVTGTANQITAVTTGGAVTLSLPSAITVSGAITAGSFVGNATSATNLAGGAAGSIHYQSAANATTTLPIGTNGQVLSVVSGVPAWAAVPSSITAVNGTANQITATTAAGVTTLALPSAVTISGSMTAGSFVGPLTGNATTATNIAAGTVGAVHYQSAVGVTSQLPIGATGQVLTVVGGVPAWTSAGGATIADDTATAATYYPTFVTTTTGAASTVKTSSTKMTFNPATGTFFATQVATSSDANLKENIQEIADAVATVKELVGVEFDWKGGGKSYGVIAQEIEQVLPAVVNTDGNGVKSVNYQALSGFFIQAIKELADRVTALENK